MTDKEKKERDEKVKEEMLRKKYQQVALTPEQFAESYDRLFRPEIAKYNYKNENSQAN